MDRIARTLLTLTCLSLAACDEQPPPPKGLELRSVGDSEVIPSGAFSRDNTIRMGKGEHFDVKAAALVPVGTGFSVSCEIVDRDEPRLRSFLAANDPNGIVLYVQGRPVTMAVVNPRAPASVFLDTGDEAARSRSVMQIAQGMRSAVASNGFARNAA